jgi:putrescine transport system substrate-binding protein
MWAPRHRLQRLGDGAEKCPGPDAKIDSCDIAFCSPEPQSTSATHPDAGPAGRHPAPAALSYLGIDPNLTKQADLKKAPSSSARSGPTSASFIPRNIIRRAGVGRICCGGMVSDVMQARSRAAEARNGIEIGYTIPKEGAQMFFDNLAIPADARNVTEAYELINYLYRPDVAAKNSDFLSYANGNLASQKLVDPKILNDKNIYPDEAMQKKLFVIQARDPATQRIINRLWTKVKTGK